MLLLAFPVLLGTTLAADPAHLKPEALSANLEQAFLVEDVLWITHPFLTLVEIPTYLRDMTDQLGAALSQLEDNFPEEVRTSAHFFPLLRARLTYLNDTLTLALDNYIGITLANHTKRGVINGIGQFLCMLFGTAMNEYVVELREKSNQLTSFASAQNKLIHLNSQNIKKLEKQVQAPIFRGLL